MKNIYLFSNIYPLYRKSIWDKLLKSKKVNITFFFSHKSFNNIAIVPLQKAYSFNERKAFKPLLNIFLFKWLFWQYGVLSRTFDKVSTVIFLGEMTVISTWIAALIFKLRGVKVLFWGHGLYGSESYFKRQVRFLFLKLADHNLVYDNRAKKLMINHGFQHDKISVIYNSINYEKQKELFNRHFSNSNEGLFKNELPTLLFIGRLTLKKKVHELIKAVVLLNNDDHRYNLLIVGDGHEKQVLKKLAKQLIKKKQCIFYGSTYNEEEISKLILNSQLVVSPGNIGLTAIHSLSYGTPVCSHSNFENQMPEVEAIIEGQNGFLFKEGDLESLTKGVLDWFKHNSNLDREKVRSTIDKYYNPEFQIKVIEKVIV